MLNKATNSRDIDKTIIIAITPTVWWVLVSILSDGGPGEFFHMFCFSGQWMGDNLCSHCFVPRRLPVNKIVPTIKIVIHTEHIIWKSPSKSENKNIRFPTCMEIVGQKRIKREMSSIGEGVVFNSLHDTFEVPSRVTYANNAEQLDFNDMCISLTLNVSRFVPIWPLIASWTKSMIPWIELVSKQWWLILHVLCKKLASWCTAQRPCPVIAKRN